MLIDGERFDVPIHLTLEEYFKINNEFFFGKGNPSFIVMRLDT